MSAQSTINEALLHQPGQAADNAAGIIMPDHIPMQERTPAGTAPANSQGGLATSQPQPQPQSEYQQPQQPSLALLSTVQNKEQPITSMACLPDIRQESLLCQATPFNSAQSLSAPSCVAETQAESRISTAAAAAAAAAVNGQGQLKRRAQAAAAAAATTAAGNAPPAPAPAPAPAAVAPAAEAKAGREAPAPAPTPAPAPAPAPAPPAAAAAVAPAAEAKAGREAPAPAPAPAAAAAAAALAAEVKAGTEAPAPVAAAAAMMWPPTAARIRELGQGAAADQQGPLKHRIEGASASSSSAPAPAPAPAPAASAGDVPLVPPAPAPTATPAAAMPLMGSRTAAHIWELGQGAPVKDIDIASDGQPGFFRLVPASWLHLFIKQLPGASKAALFATSKWLATWVLQTADKVELKLIGENKQPLTPEQTEVRRSILTHLLSVRQQGFALTLWPKAWLPVPVQLAAQVHSIKVDLWATIDSDIKPISICCSWVTLTNLHTVQLVDEQDTIGLCEAVEAGHLQQLRHLDMSSCPNQLPDAARLARVAGQQLEHISLVCHVRQPLLHKTHQFTRLHVFEVRQCHLTEGIMQQLCSHPTLRHVTLFGCELQGDHSRRSCYWDSLTLDAARLHTPVQRSTYGINLLSLPLAGIQQVHLQGSLTGGRAGSMQGVESMLAPHLHKITCHPDTLTPSPRLFDVDWERTYTLSSPSEAMVPLLQRMMGVEVLRLTYDVKDPCVNGAIWQGLPPSICAIHLEIHGAQWTHLWQGLPQHVTGIKLKLKDVSATDLQGLVCSTPLHVHTMLVRVSVPNLQMAWQDFTEQVCAATPAHLQFQLHRW